MTQSILGIIGGSGFYNLPGLDNASWYTVASPWGQPSDQILFAEIAGPGRTAQTIVESYNRDEEARALAASVESAVAQVALIEVSAVGLGALVLTVLATSAADTLLCTIRLLAGGDSRCGLRTSAGSGGRALR